MQRFIFYDFETTGTSPAYDQPLQFAAIVTDENFNALETIDIRCRVAPHIIPSPYALKVTNVAPEQTTNTNLPTAFEFAQTLFAFVKKWEPAIWIGYNTIAFDEQMMRQLFYQNLQPNIYATQSSGNSRLDVMKMVHVVFDKAQHILEFPINEKGKPSFKLDMLAPANGFAHENAHDALADVEATIFILNKIKNADRDLYDELIRTSNKDEMAQLLKGFAPVEVTQRYGGSDPKTYQGCYCGTSTGNANEIGFLDITDDVADLISGDEEAIEEAINSSPKRIRALSLNKAESFRAIINPSPEQLEKCSAIANAFELHRIVGEKLASRFDEQDESEQNIEDKIYGKFYSWADKERLEQFQSAPWEQRQEITEEFEDARLKQLGRRLIAFYAPHLLSQKQVQQYRDFVKSKWERDSESAEWTTIASLRKDLAELPNESDMSAEQYHRMLEFYRNYLNEFGCKLE